MSKKFGVINFFSKYPMKLNLKSNLKTKQLEEAKPVELSSDTLIEDANRTVSNALEMFNATISQVTLANKKLAEASQKISEHIESLNAELNIKQKEKETAKKAIEANNILKEKLSQFVVK